MPDNVYAPPQASLESEARPPRGFFSVSRHKFLVLFIATQGLYSVHWFFQNWQAYKRTNGVRIWPMLRALFAIFFVHSLFRKVNQRLLSRGASYPWRPALQAWLWIGLPILGAILARMIARVVGEGGADATGLLMVPVLAFVMLPAVMATNAAANDPDGEGNQHYGIANYVWIVLGVLMWLLTVVKIVVTVH